MNATRIRANVLPLRARISPCTGGEDRPFLLPDPMSAASTLDASPLALREACHNVVRHLRTLGYPHADHTTCERMLRAFFPYEPILSEGSPDVQAGADFLERFLHECLQRQRETSGTASPRPRRCYGQAVEAAVTAAESHGEQAPRAPRLTELMTQLDADGHNTTQLRIELEGLIDELGMCRFYR
jgi:hypothetical protein